MLFAAALVVAVALAYFSYETMWVSRRAGHAEAASIVLAPAVPDKSIAVLPFVDMSERHDQEYFSDGLSEELIDHLAHSADLKVIARTSSFQFKGRNDDMRTIGRMLGVANLLEGSVRRSGNAVRITAQLIKVIDGAHRWSQTYDRKVSDIFKVQDEIAAKVVEALRASLALDGVQQATVPTNVDTQVMLLQARFFENRGTTEDIQRAVAYYRKAAELEPSSPLVWANLSIAQSKLTGYELLTWRQARKETLEYAEHALRLDPANAKAHEALGRVRLFDMDWAGADREFDRAVQIDPQLHPKEKIFLVSYLGRLSEALTSCQEWVVRDPLNHFSFQQLAQTLWSMGRNAEAEVAIRKAIEISPSALYPHSMLAMLLGTRGAAAEAFSEIAREPNEFNRAYATAVVYQLLRRKPEASAALVNFEQKFGKNSPTIVAELYEINGDSDQAFRWLNVAYDDPENRADLSGMKVDPFFNPLHGDPRWKSLLQRLNLPE
jgi:TolB-like protein